MTPRRILLIEDEHEIAELIHLHLGDLEEPGVEIVHVADGVAGLTLALGEQWDLVLLDLSLPRCDGLDVCEGIRHQDAVTPIVVITARGEETDRVRGLDLGADDYITKPFSVVELVARVRAIFRRVDATVDTAPSGLIVAGDIVLQPSAHEARVAGRLVALTPREFDLLVEFCRAPGQVFKRSELLRSVWGYSHEGYLHTVNTHINRLRAKIEPDPGHPSYITTVWGVGYKFVPANSAP